MTDRIPLSRPAIGEREEALVLEVLRSGRLSLGPFRLRFLQVAHSIPDCVGMVIATPAAKILFTGDWKLDPTPVDGKATDMAGFAEVGREGIDLMLSDSTNALVPGHLPSERTAGEAVREVVRRAAGRVVIACFASNIHRIQQILNAARESGRLVAFIGRSMAGRCFTFNVKARTAAKRTRVRFLARELTG